jgi:hypothetical protein
MGQFGLSISTGISIASVASVSGRDIPFCEMRLIKKK